MRIPKEGRWVRSFLPVPSQVRRGRTGQGGQQRHNTWGVAQPQNCRLLPPNTHTSFSSLPNITISSTAGSLILLIPQVPCDPPVQCGCFPTAVPCDPHAGAPCLCLTMSSLKSWLLTVGPLDLPDVSPVLPDGETSPTIQSCLLMLASLLLLPRSKV